MRRIVPLLVLCLTSLWVGNRLLAAEVEPMGAVAIQLCQHNCPVVDAARAFPVLCEAETAERPLTGNEAIARAAKK